MLIMAFPLYAIVAFLNFTDWATVEEVYTLRAYLLPLAFIAQTGTIWVTVLVAFNRYIAVCRPFSAARLCTVVQASAVFHILARPLTY